MIPCTKSELLIFDETPVQVALNSASWVDFHSISNPDSGGPLEFFIAGTQDEYLDLNDTKLYLQVSVETTPGNAICAPVNLLHSSLFQDVSISLNDVTVQGGTQLYSYKSMIETMLLFDENTKATQLEPAGYVADEASKFEDATNSGFVSRTNWITNKTTHELIGALHLDLMTQPKYIIPQVNVKIRMTRQSSKFALLSWDNTNTITSSKIKIKKAVLYVRKVKVLPSVLDGHEIGLDNNNAIYPIQHVDMQTITVPAGGMSFNRENHFQGRMPKLVVVCMVDNRAFNGSYTYNPYNFQHFNVNYCGLFRDGESIPERTPYQLDAPGQYARPYMGMIHALEQFNRNENNGITLHDYVHGNMFFVFNLTPDLTAGSGCQQPYRSGNIRLELKFQNALANTINVIVYGVFDGKIEITKDRQVKLDYL